MGALADCAVWAIEAVIVMKNMKMVATADIRIKFLGTGNSLLNFCRAQNDRALRARRSITPLTYPAHTGAGKSMIDLTKLRVGHCSLRSPSWEADYALVVFVADRVPPELRSCVLEERHSRRPWQSFPPD